MSELRIGLGIDLHRLAPGRACMVGGIEVPSPVGPAGHSDGDAVLHAACDACLGAAGMEDLGTLFPDSDAAHAGRRSADFCHEVRRRLEGAGWCVLSMDVVVETEQPRLRAWRDTVRASLAALFGVDAGAVNLKGKSGEGMDAVGRGEALRATAVVLLGR